MSVSAVHRLLARLAGGPKFVGLLYPMVVAAMTFIIGVLLLKETRTGRIED